MYIHHKDEPRDLIRATEGLTTLFALQSHPQKTLRTSCIHACLLLRLLDTPSAEHNYRILICPRRVPFVSLEIAGPWIQASRSRMPDSAVAQADPDVVHGECYCGGFKFEVRVPGEKCGWAGYCHCESCKRAHASPIYHVCYVPEEYFTVTSGKELVKEFSRKPSISRFFCSTCGTRVYNVDHNTKKRNGPHIGFFPSILDHEVQLAMPEFCRPWGGTNRKEECTLDLTRLADVMP